MRPKPGLYLALVHGFETDQVSGGPGSNYSLFTWSIGVNDDVGNLDVAAPQAVTNGEHLDMDVTWSGLDPATRYIGAISHTTPDTLPIHVPQFVRKPLPFAYCPAKKTSLARTPSYDVSE